MRSKIAFCDQTERISVGAFSAMLERRRLMQLVFEASDSVDWAQTMGNSTMVPAPVLRSVILYCFALNICASEEIIEASETDAGVNYLRANFEFE